ncbi:MAG: hypothetical protein Q9173_004570 [Seirophora scorigena]
MIGPIARITQKCSNKRASHHQRLILRINCAMDVLTDYMITAIPISMLWKVQMPLRKKLALVGLFSLTMVTTVFAIIRTTSTTVRTTSEANMTDHHDHSWIQMWSSIEQCVAIIIACLGSYRSLFTGHRKRLGEPQQRPSGYSRNRFLRGLQRTKPGRATMELNSIFGGTETSLTIENGRVEECCRDVELAGKKSSEHIGSPDKRLCGGVHILEFLTRHPDLYTSLLPDDWRHFFATHHFPNILDFLMRTDLAAFEASGTRSIATCDEAGWLGGAVPPSSLLDYVQIVRQHSLDRTLASPSSIPASVSEHALPRHLAVGMKPKKVHEVARLARYVDHLSKELSLDRSCHIGHLVDIGSGQNYLGRALASAPYNEKVLALESKPLNIDGARSMDVTAKLAKKEVIMRNKKQFRSQNYRKQHRAKASVPALDDDEDRSATETEPSENNIQYIETVIQDGDLSSVLSRLPPNSNPPQQELMVISLHSCGNLLHHGLRSLTLNPCVRAVALVGCCYNLLTERLPPPLSPHPSLRSCNPRLRQTSSARDPHGFPMSERFTTYPHRHGPGIRFNITARMMAVQAPQNWTESECESFFTRHFYRALFQRILVDRGAIDGTATTMHAEDDSKEGDESDPAREEEEKEEKSQPIILGSLRKQCYASFTAYVRAAVEKLNDDPNHAERIKRCMSGLSDADIAGYEEKFGHKKKELSVVWSLMAFSAGVVESAIVVDRWQWLREQQEVRDCWVESIFDYGISPRNLVVVGIKGSKEGLG